MNYSLINEDLVMKSAVFIFMFFLSSVCIASEKADLVMVDKTKKVLILKSGDKILDEFHISLGGNPKGHKEREGDEKTPEGDYILDYKNANSKYYKSIHISYPNEEDIRKAREGDYDPGGDIMIHGQRNGFGWLSFLIQKFNWTDGCIAVSNKDMDVIWEAVDIGMPIVILP